MTHRIRLSRGTDEGVALVMAMALVGMAGVLIITLVSLAVREGRDTGNNRNRAASVTTAEGAVDSTLAAIQEVSVASLPCGATTSTSQNPPDTVSVTTTVTYLSSTGAVLACPPSEVTAASQVLVKAVTSSTPAGGGLPVRRTFETLAALKPKYSTDLNKAIFGNAGILIGNNFDLYGQAGPDADVYTNGDFTCSNSEHFRGSVVAPNGSIALTNSCLIDVNAYAKNGFSMSNSGSNSPNVLGDVKVSNGSANITAGTVVGKIYASQTSAYCTANPAKCVIAPVKIPSLQTFPVINGDNTTIAAYAAGGYDTTLSSFTQCDPKLPGSVGYWLENNASSITKPTVLRTPCRVSVENNAKVVSLASDVAIFADRGIDISNTVTVQSTVSGTQHQILFIHPADFATRVPETCSSLGTGISLTNTVTMSPDINQLLYSPCDIYKANQSTLYGQVYSGGVANIANKTDAYYEPVSVIGVSSTKVVEYYQADVLYKRENAG